MLWSLFSYLPGLFSGSPMFWGYDILTIMRTLGPGSWVGCHVFLNKSKSCLKVEPLIVCNFSLSHKSRLMGFSFILVVRLFRNKFPQGQHMDGEKNMNKFGLFRAVPIQTSCLHSRHTCACSPRSFSSFFLNFEFLGEVKNLQRFLKSFTKLKNSDEIKICL